MRALVPVSVFVALVVAGCAAAMPGYVPPSPSRDRMLAAVPKGGGFDEQGQYHLTEQEQKLGCKELSGSVTVKILQMRQAGSRSNPSTLAATAQNASRPLTGATKYGTDTAVDLARDRARLEMLNRRLAEKDCRTFDLDAELKPGNTAQPQPVGDAKPKSKPKPKG
jgi:hypothetical protein